MTTLDKSFSIYSLGDSAITLDLGHLIDEQLNRKALAISEWMQEHPFPGMLDIIAAYSSVTVFYDPVVTGGRSPGSEDGVYKYVGRLLEEAWGGHRQSGPYIFDRGDYPDTCVLWRIVWP